MTAIRDAVFKSPARLVLTLLLLAVPLAVGLVIGTALGRPPAAAPTAKSSPPTTLPAIDPQAATDAAEVFVGIWCKQGARTPEQWTAEMRSRSTPTLAAAWSPPVIPNLSGDCPMGRSKPRTIYPHRVQVTTEVAGPDVLTDVVQGPRGELLVDGIQADEYGGD